VPDGIFGAKLRRLLIEQHLQVRFVCEHPTCLNERIGKFGVIFGGGGERGLADIIPEEGLEVLLGSGGAGGDGETAHHQANNDQKSSVHRGTPFASASHRRRRRTTVSYRRCGLLVKIKAIAINRLPITLQDTSGVIQK